jgi:hypothetical protein
MSDAVFSQLPRFDAVSAARPADWLRAMNAGEMQAPARPAVQEEAAPAPAPAQKPEPSVVHPIPQETAALQATVSSLAKLMERIDVESRQYAADAVQRISAQLFPELSRRFLAEEIARHLPAVIPATVPVVDIRAEPVLAAQLQEIVNRHPSLEGRCNIIPEAGQGGSCAEVSWRTGGATFDFEGLLTACLNDLGSTHKQNTEYK